MALTQPPLCDFGIPAPPFSLPDPDGNTHSLSSIAGTSGTLVMFICNHCPYVKAIQHALVSTTNQLMKQNIGCVAIMSNDYHNYPEDAPAHMKAISVDLQYPFPYLIDEDQSVAKAYQAVCTPDFFGYNKSLELQYRGRLNSARNDQTITDPVPELANAMQQIAATGKGPQQQHPSMGCNIKWKH